MLPQSLPLLSRLHDRAALRIVNLPSEKCRSGFEELPNEGCQHYVAQAHSSVWSGARAGEVDALRAALLWSRNEISLAARSDESRPGSFNRRDPRATRRSEEGVD
jgi:hypothetical protein